MRRLSLAFVVVCCFTPYSALSQVDKYHVTAQEKIACTKDAMRLCMSSYPDEDKMLNCMKDNIPQLTPICRVAFVAGLRHRHMM